MLTFQSPTLLKPRPSSYILWTCAQDENRDLNFRWRQRRHECGRPRCGQDWHSQVRYPPVHDLYTRFDNIDVYRGCEMYVVREGYEGLARGNTEAGEIQGQEVNATTVAAVAQEVKIGHFQSQTEPDVNLLHNLRFGDGDLLKDGTCEFVGGRTLKGRYIVRVGWDDVRGWFSEVRSLNLFQDTMLTGNCREAPSSVLLDL